MTTALESFDAALTQPLVPLVCALAWQEVFDDARRDDAAADATSSAPTLAGDGIR
jgi:hypothetical protein